MNPWIPAPVAVAWSLLFMLVVLVHVWHAVVLGGRHRLWHLGHVLMAVGMVVMFWPDGSAMGSPAAVGVAVYLGAAGFVVVSLAVARARRLDLGPLWPVIAVDLAWMAYMFAMASYRLMWLSVLGVLWFAAQALGWATGRLGRVLERGGLGEAVPASVGSTPSNRGTEATEPSSTNQVGRGERGASGDSEPEILDGVIDSGRRDWSVRISLAVMGAGMAYMLLAMQFGTSAMAGGPGGMPGM